VLSDSARAFSGDPESTCSYGGVFRMLRDFTIGMVKLWSCCDLCTGLQKTLEAAVTSAKAVRELWGHILTAAVLRVPKPQGILLVLVIIVTVTRLRG